MFLTTSSRQLSEAFENVASLFVSQGNLRCFLTCHGTLPFVICNYRWSDYYLKWHGVAAKKKQKKTLVLYFRDSHFGVTVGLR